MSVNDGIKEWWESVPIATMYGYLFAGSAAVTFGANFGLFNVMKIVYIPEMVYKSFEIWRPITGYLFMGGLGFSMLINFVFLLQYSKMLESGRFGGRLADYVFMLAFGCSILLIPATLFHFMVLADGLIMYLLYVWARTNPDVIVSFMFGLKFKAAYFPWVLIAFKVLLGGMPLLDILGAFVGHLYIYLKDIYPAVAGKHYLNTPQFLLNLLPPGAGINERGGVAPPNVQVPQGRQWGQGQRLGGR